MAEFEIKRDPEDLSFEGLFGANTKYEYFKDADRQPFQFAADNYQSVNAWWLAEASMLVYVQDEDFVRQQLKNAGLLQTYFIDEKGTQCFVSHNDDFAIVCFRGTEASEPQDILTDLKVRPTGNSKGNEVHTGFKEALDHVWNDIKGKLDKITDAGKNGIKVWFTGHSLGAALATLAADRYPTAQGVYTFGSPRVGDSRFVQGYQVAITALSITTIWSRWFRLRNSLTTSMSES